MNLLSKLILLLLCVNLGCGSSRPQTTEPSLASANDEQKSSPALSPALIKSLRQSDIILIGETHDHPQHHKIQAEIIRLSEPKSVAFEMLNQGQEESIAQLSQTSSESWDQILKWSHRGWPKFELYQEVFKNSLKYSQSILPAHPSPQTLQPLKLGLELDQKLKTELKLDHPLPTEQKQILRKEITEAHCGHASEPLVRAMISAQRLKDAWMARALIKAPKPVILIVGRGHIQADRGIPWAINLLAPQNSFKILTIALSPQDTQTSLAPHTNHKNGVQRLHLKIKAHRNDDPCERFKEQLKRLKKHPFKHPPTHSPAIKTNQSKHLPESKSKSVKAASPPSH